MIRKIQHMKIMRVKSGIKMLPDLRKDTHIETHLVTTYWFLFIPIWISYNIAKTNL